MEKAEKTDLLYGAPAIAEYLNFTDWQVYNLHRRRREQQFPTFKIGKAVCSRKADLDRWIDQQARAAAEAGNHA